MSAPPDDPASLSPAGAGDGEFLNLYESTLTPLRRYLTALLGSHTHEAHDLAHDAYLRTFSAMQGRPVSNPRSLLFTAARNLAFTHRARYLKRTVAANEQELEAGLPLAPTTDEVVTEREVSQALHSAILALPPGCRRVLILRNLEGLGYQEIAVALGISVSAVEKNLQRALRLLRDQMKQSTE